MTRGTRTAALDATAIIVPQPAGGQLAISHALPVSLLQMSATVTAMRVVARQEPPLAHVSHVKFQERPGYLFDLRKHFLADVLHPAVEMLCSVRRVDRQDANHR